MSEDLKNLVTLDIFILGLLHSYHPYLPLCCASSPTLYPREKGRKVGVALTVAIESLQG